MDTKKENTSLPPLFEGLPTDEQVRPLLGQDVTFNVRSRGLDVYKTGVLVALLRKGETLETAKVRTANALSPDMPKWTGAGKARSRADVLLVLANENGKDRWFTPRVQQAVSVPRKGGKRAS